MSRTVNGAEAVREALAHLMRINSRVVTYGLGVNDPGKVFGTTAGLLEEFGPERVFETPTSELALTGVGVGLAIAGHPVVHSHQRMDFALLAMDQLVNSAAKWRYMFGDQFSVPYLVRMIIGRGWGQGPTHSQNLESWLVHTPGLRVLVPATPQDLADSILALEGTEEPIVLIEHRWIHSVIGEVELGATNLEFLDPISHRPAVPVNLTIVTWGLATFDSLAAKQRLEKHGVYAEVIQLRELSVKNFELIERRASVSGHLLVVTNSWSPASFGDSILAEFAGKSSLNVLAGKVSYPHEPEATALSQLQGFHVSDWRVMNAALDLMDMEERVDAEFPIDQPKGYNFGPF
jgi:pyruvate dehydrogenase E1 component beta subunit